MIRSLSGGESLNRISPNANRSNSVFFILSLLQPHFHAAYFAEIYRGGIESMPVGQYEAAKLLGYSRVQTFFRIIFPQVIKRIMPSVTNEVITLVKV